MSRVTNYGLLVTLAWLAGSVAAVAADTSKLPDSVASVLQHHRVPANSVSVVVQEIGADSDPLVSFNADESMNPASTIKLLTTWLALEELGPAFKWPTEAYLDGELEGGSLDGDLIIKGYGDPYFITERLWGFQRQLRLQGLQHIKGDLVIDSSYFLDEYGDPGEFDGEALRAYNVVPNAFLVNFQAMNLVYKPDLAAGKVTVLADPVPLNLYIDNRLRLVDGYCGGYQNGITVAAADPQKRDRIILTGRFGRNCEQYRMTRSALTGPTYAYGVFKALWEETSGTLAGELREGEAPEDETPFLRVESPPLDDVIEYVNKFSNNVMARHLLLTLGVQAFDAPATQDKGRRAAYAALQRRGLNFEELRLDNGAGLSRETRISAASLARVLIQATQSPWESEYVSSLSLSGLDGTMRKRFTDEEMTGRMHLKTGRLQNVFATAGYVHARSGKDYAVVILQNFKGADDGPGEAAQIALLRWAYDQ
jgi:D-alanyl-D-alanine carboxypeptidase/D-alanyl-D-alanine-endopeptidase (penicillin-binding protein 4)